MFQVNTEPSELLYPLAFIHTLHTINKRYPHLSMDNIGALIMDSRRSPRQTAGGLSILLDPAKCSQVGDGRAVSVAHLEGDGYGFDSEVVDVYVL